LVGVALVVLAVLTAIGWAPGMHPPDYRKISAADVASLAVAGATLLLADFIAILAWLTRRSLAATRREAEIAEAALAVSNRQAATAERALAVAEQQRTEQWEPLVTARLDQTPGGWPRSVTVTNLATGPAIDCVYVAVFKDSLSLEMWHVTNPIDLHGAERELTLNRAHGFDRVTYLVNDTNEFDPDSGRTLRRTIRRSMRAFSADDHVKRGESRETSHVGLPAPSVELFTHQDGTHQIVDGRQEAVICTCANGHVHRTLPHLRKPAEQFQPDDQKVSWLKWYITEARFGIPVPADADLMRPEADPVVISKEPI
jgi:hypothetical protein